MIKSALTLPALGVEPAGKTSGERAAYRKSEIDNYGRIVRAVGLNID